MSTDFNKRNGLAFGAFSFLGGVMLSLVSRVVYAFVFLPDFHGSWAKACSYVFDNKGWLAYMIHPFGFFTTFAAFVLMIGVPIYLVSVTDRRS